MAAPTTPAFVHRGDFNDVSRAHPAMNWMEKYTKAFDANAGEKLINIFEEWHSNDYSYHRADNVEFTGGKAAFQEICNTYQFFHEMYHEPYYMVTTELPSGDGWEMIGQALLYGNFPGQPTGKGVQDKQGRDWQFVIPGAFHFTYKKDPAAKHDGITMTRTEVQSDAHPIVIELLNRGVLKPEAMGVGLPN